MEKYELINMYCMYKEGFSKLPDLLEEMLNRIKPLSREEAKNYVPIIKLGEKR